MSILLINPIIKHNCIIHIISIKKGINITGKSGMLNASSRQWGRLGLLLLEYVSLYISSM